jgi:threonine aldolase
MYGEASTKLGAAIDLRSDTVTLPSPAMREAMVRAELGDDVYGEDPTVQQLETLAAEMVGKEAALLVPSGTMGNLAALLSHCGRGERVIVGDKAHIFRYEAGGASTLGGMVFHTVNNQRDGTLDPEGLVAALQRVNDSHFAPPGVLCLENTHNLCGGTVLTPAYMAEIAEQARAAGVPVHLDGARVFNAAVALGEDVRVITRHVDTVQFCLSKGLAAPVGSIVAGPRSFIERAHRARKMLGGGMRQAGIIAAAGVVALSEMVERLDDDHRHARLLAEGLANIPGIAIDLDLVQTDIVRFDLVDERFSVADFMAALRERGVLMGGMGGRIVRAVTHYGIDENDIATTIDAVQTVLAM